MQCFELSRERDWLAPDRPRAGPPFVKHQFMIRQLCYGIVDARAPKNHPCVWWMR